MLEGQNEIHYAMREKYFITWFRTNRPRLYDQYIEGLPYGHYSMWLLYLWSDGDTYVDKKNLSSCRVNVRDRRIYFRTALKCIITDQDFDTVEFEDNDDRVYAPNDHDGQLKLQTLVSLLSPGEYVYVGSGKENNFRQILSPDITFLPVDPFFEGGGTLAHYDFRGKKVINDAFYDGFESDQERLADAELYFAKQSPVAPTDYCFLLPGSSEARYTNDKRFSGFMLDFFSNICTAITRNAGVSKALSLSVGSHVVARAKPDTMAFRVATKYAEEATVNMPFEEFILYDFTSRSYTVANCTFGKLYIQEKFKFSRVTSAFSDYVNKLCNDKEFEKQERIKFPHLCNLDVQYIQRLLTPPQLEAEVTRHDILQLKYCKQIKDVNVGIHLFEAYRMVKQIFYNYSCEIYGSETKELLALLTSARDPQTVCKGSSHSQQIALYDLIVYPDKPIESYICRRDAQVLVIDLVLDYTRDREGLRRYAGYKGRFPRAFVYRAWKFKGKTKTGTTMYWRSDFSKAY